MTDDSGPASGPEVRPCRNCGAPAPGDYCPACGQETRASLPTLREFMREAAGRYVAIDGRLWRTLAALAFRPGFLTREYFAGRRRRYIRPARLFLVMAVILFFLIRLTVEVDGATDVANVDRPRAAESAAKVGAAGTDALDLELSEAYAIRIDKDNNLVLKGAPGAVADKLDKRLAHFNRLPPQEKLEQMIAGALRYGPYAMVVLLPAFAWLQMIAHMGRPRRYPGRPRHYAEHLVYGAHLHTFLFMMLALAVALPWPPLRFLLAAWAVWYVLSAKQNVYGGSRIGSLLRGVVVGLVYMALMLLAMVGLLLAAILLR